MWIMGEFFPNSLIMFHLLSPFINFLTVMSVARQLILTYSVAIWRSLSFVYLI